MSAWIMAFAISIEKCCLEPMQAVATAIAPGLALARSVKSGAVLMGELAGTISMLGAEPINETAEKFLTASHGNFLCNVGLTPQVALLRLGGV